MINPYVGMKVMDVYGRLLEVTEIKGEMVYLESEYYSTSEDIDFFSERFYPAGEE